MDEELAIPTTCNSHCGGACRLKVYVKSGTITRLETDDTEEPQFRACLRGRAYRQRVYSPDRLKYPLRRVGKRGGDRFERISWDEAAEVVVGEIKRVRNTYGPASIVYFCSAADIHILHHLPPIHRLLCLFGGYTSLAGHISYEGGVFAEAVSYGTFVGTSHTRDDMLNSRLIILWGWDPANSIQGTGTSLYLARAREKGIKIVSVDPRFTDTTATFSDEWIPIRPATDTAMLVAMAHEIISRNHCDRSFLARYTAGFEKFEAYVTGREDGIPKTPEWAELITGVPAGTIRALAYQYATSKPANLLAGISPGRTAYGEQYHRAAIVLTAMTGNIGIHGGSAAARSWGGEYWGGELPFAVLTKGRIRSPGNPVDKLGSQRPKTIPARGISTNLDTRVNVNRFADAVLKGKAGGYPADYKFLYLANTNYLNQLMNTNKIVQAFQALEFIVVQEQFMTPTAKFADIILPTTTFLERNDITQGGATPFYGYVNKAIEPLYECKSHLDIACTLAEKSGEFDVKHFSDKTEGEWLQGIAEGLREVVTDLPDHETFKRCGIHKVKRSEPYVAFQQQIMDPTNHPFPTPSGKIEIFSQQLADFDDPELPPIPKYIAPWEGPQDAHTGAYPLQLITSHFKRRAHSQFDNLPWLRELLEQSILINPADAEARQIKDGDLVKVFNERGSTVTRAKVTGRIMPGVVDLPQGAWFNPDKNGVDRAGSANVLTIDRISPGGSIPTNSCLVQVRKWEEREAQSI